MPRRLVALLFVIPTLASANSARRSTEAGVVGDAVGLIDVAIVREELAIDLRPVEHAIDVRPVEQGKTAIVNVVYHLENRGEPKQLPLIFASGGFTLIDFEVTLDGAAIRSNLVHGANSTTS